MQTTPMKNLAPLISLLTLFSVCFSACSFIAGIFKAGMGFGIFLVILAIAVIFIVILRAGKK
jgi:hypothetical protein